MVVGGDQQGFVLFGTRQQGIPILMDLEYTDNIVMIIESSNLNTDSSEWGGSWCKNVWDSLSKKKRCFSAQ
ncbi:unnamed protein product [Schistosoma mattheei]|uniref:Uncharacterized protein n=1 Tax=Schistosoma mattheei TaxID=31246 RepID=A0A183PVX2_9TREM|nr:unnamed protein product [Schistosoma mattheei]